MWPILLGAHISVLGTTTYKYTHEDDFKANNVLKSSWPYGNEPVTSSFAPHINGVSVCPDTESCSLITFELSSLEDCDEAVKHPETKTNYVKNMAASNYVLTDGARRS